MLTSEQSDGGCALVPRVEQSLAWWQRGTIYQIYPLSFQDTNGEGKGDLKGILSRVAYLKWLGIDAVWLGPVYRSPMADFGYDIADFTEIDSVFGSLADLDRLIESLHQNDIRLILDFVPNHTSDQHPWFIESRSSKANPKRDWYVWVDPAADGPPNNWLSRFGGSAWEWDSTTRQYYYHAFLKEQPDLNWRNPEVRAAMADVLRFWLRRGIDGFRIDAAAVLAEDALLRDDPPNTEANDGTPPPERLKRVYTDARPEVLDWLAELRRVVDEYPDRVLLAEVDTSPDRIAQFYGDKNRPIMHLPLNYRLLDTQWNAEALGQMIESYYRSLPEHGWPCWVIGSHDKKRVASVIGAAQARVAAMLLLTLPGTPIFYAGDELGMVGGTMEGAQPLDPFERYVPGYGLNRDPERTPMQWEDKCNAGFTTGTPWLPVASDYPLHNVETERADEHSTLNLYRKLLEFRRLDPTLSFGKYSGLVVNGHVLSFTRNYENRCTSIVLNLSNGSQEWRIPNGQTARVVLSTYVDEAANPRATGKITLRANEGLIIVLAAG